MSIFSISSTNKMTDIVYLYPKTSCPCGESVEKWPLPQGQRTNLSVQGCKVPEFFEYHDRLELSNAIEPRNKQGWVEINPQVYTEKYDPTFSQVKCQTAKGCPQPSWVSADPRMYYPQTDTYMALDRPPINGNVRLDNVYNESLDGYGIGFTPYEKIRDGQIVYYVDRSIEDAFFKPNFSDKSRETAVLYQDPMGSLKPEYNREPLINTENPTVTTALSYPDCLSFIQDTSSFREDLMALQMRKRNQERWDTRWSV